MRSSADIYGIIPRKEGGYVLAKTNFAEGVGQVGTTTLVAMKRKDPTLHFVSFAFVEVQILQKYFTSEGELKSHVRRHLVPAGIWGSIKANCYVWMELDGSDFRKFEYEMATQDEFMTMRMFMEGMAQMGQKDAAAWNTGLEFAEKGGAK